jgi:organic radical activating enzyme
MIKRFLKTLLSGDPFLWWLKITVNPRQGNFTPKGGRFSRGVYLTITPTARCPVKCWYCPLLSGRQEWPEFEECSMVEWKELISTFPEWVSLVGICGGEPTILKWLPEFTNWLLGTGRKVVIFTNLINWKILLQIKKSSRLQIQATYHHKQSAEDFVVGFDTLDIMGYNIEAFEVDVPDETKVLPFTKLKPFIGKKEELMNTQFHCAPDAPKTKIIYLGMERNYRSLK